MGYFAVAFTLGITAKNIGMTPVQAAVSSMLLHASAGQYAAMTVIASGTGYLEMVMTAVSADVLRAVTEGWKQYENGTSDGGFLLYHG